MSLTTALGVFLYVAIPLLVFYVVVFAFRVWMLDDKVERIAAAVGRRCRHESHCPCWDIDGLGHHWHRHMRAGR